MRRTFFLIAIFAGMLAGATAWAQGCGKTPDVYASLADNHGESRIASGVNPDGKSVIETWANMETGTWTVMRTTASGLSCVLANGDNIRLFEPHPAGVPL